jgi:periplasmic divalent cation tolerance protein
MPIQKKSVTPFLVFTTVAKKPQAIKISKILLEKKLAACVTTLPRGESRYYWNGKIFNDQEYVLMIKTVEGIFPILQKTLKEIHPYECPEIIGIRLDKIAPAYQQWLAKNVGP